MPFVGYVAMMASIIAAAPALVDEMCAMDSEPQYRKKPSFQVSLLAAVAHTGVPELDNLQEVQQRTASEPSVVMFYADWCPHCQRMAPIFSEVAGRVASDGVSFYTVNAADHKDIGRHFGVGGYPTIKYFAGRDGEEPVHYPGKKNPEVFENFVREAHAAANPSADCGEACSNMGCPDGWQVAVSRNCACSCKRA